MLVVKNLTKTFTTASGSVSALENVSLTVETGEFASIIGKSGSGKSTFLSMLGALDIPTSGKIEVDGVDIAKLSANKQTAYRAKKIGFVFQHYNLIPNLSALENVMLALEFGGMPMKKRKARAEQLLTDVGLEPDEQLRKPARLSGGQQQRVSIARAIANHPAIVLADEPTGNLDSETGKKIFDLLHRLSRSEKTTILAVTHDMNIAGKTDRTFKLKDGKIAN
ncbi:ABC transporter [Candidatus Saccharibacteria bacterium CG11_big_fil_rev_8_21_14_0_20_41_19]|nr:ABC transporter ATP-binding protein [Candidatus Saccharibacteria bacterium]OIP86346.1 MAG: ABC transporter [Candidatus Saccharibacteria bacterium CG2_30_41_52]PIQ71129.1 MAG: ABC transporter [Candidatus Saccharibacteria bacterium CG11_big_fil_rev_8_21_14_0_20_41_19]PIZ59945.1 MAG: ABC transporter [Candidatus Saccharibacteria bacterium CG_4_10_14_0_2_um_filter_41_11]PJE65969.1 MAG: ABC transporter [Candidatus Saccharibacteria bacterium CG10_big_fil_rev_8_21_14_0_10_41_32]